MKVGINGRFLASPFTGIGQYSYNLISALAKKNMSDEFVVVCNEKPYFDFSKNVKIILEKEKKIGTAGMKKTYWEQVQVPSIFKKEKIDIAHYPYPSNNWKKPKYPVVVTVHDTIPWTMSAYKKSFSTKAYQKKCRDAVRIADFVITVSNASKTEIVQVCKVNEEKISVIYNSPSVDFYKKFGEEKIKKILSGNGVKRPFFLYTGGYDSRKNVPVLIDAFLERVAPNHYIDFVFTGYKSQKKGIYPGIDCLTQLKNTANLKPTKGKVIVTGYISGDEFPALYQSCYAFVNLSVKEGFNLPLVEAAVSGVPVITSDIGVHREVIGDFATYVKPHEKSEIGYMLEKFVTDKQHYEVRKQQMKNFKWQYSWDKAAEDVYRIYKKVLCKSSGQ